MSNIATADYNRNGKLFYAMNQAGATVTLINTSTTTGFVLSNPWGSGKKLVIQSASFVYTTAPTAISTVFLCHSVAPSAAAHATTTALSIYAADGSGASTQSVARAYSVSTTPNLPVYSRILAGAEATGATALANMRDQIEGAIVLVPGSYLQTSYIGQAAVGMTEVYWIEVDL